MERATIVISPCEPHVFHMRNRFLLLDYDANLIVLKEIYRVTNFYTKITTLEQSFCNNTLIIMMKIMYVAFWTLDFCLAKNCATFVVLYFFMFQCPIH